MQANKKFLNVIYFALLVMWFFNTNANHVLAESYVPIIGIPSPAFGLEETVTNIYGSDDYYTYYVDNTDPNATDNSNPNGSKGKPRLTIPNNPSAGSVVEIHGGPYTGISIFGNSGTSSAPIFIRGKAANKPTIQATFRVQASNVIIENLIFDQNQDVRASISIYPQIAANPVHYVCVRGCELRNYCNTDACTGGHNSVMAVGDYNSTGVYPHDIVFYKNNIHDNGYSSPTVDRDIHAIQVSKSEYVWILENEMHNNAGDAVQVITAISDTSTASPINHVYIGRNVMHGEHENAVDLKRCTDVVISENTMYDFQGISAGNSGSACAIVVHMGGSKPLTPRNILIINNEIYNVKDAAVISESDANEVYFVGNVVHDIGLTSTSSVFAAFTLWATGSHYFYNNLFYNVLSGIRCTGGSTTSSIDGSATSSTSDVKNNIFAKMRHSPYYHFYMGGYSGDSRPTHTLLDHNLFYQEDGNISIAWYWNFNNLTNFQNDIGQGAGCIDSNPLLMNPGNNNYRLLGESPVIGKGTDIGTALTTIFGINQLTDIDGNPRPQNGWDMGPYEYVASGTSILEMEKQTTINPYPNPFNLTNGQKLLFPNVNQNSTLSIYNIIGELIRIISTNSAGQMEWDGKNSQGLTLSDGVYIYIIKDESGSRKTGKIIINR